MKIIDFGSSGVPGLEEIGSPVETPRLLGTRGYAAPEYHLGHKQTNRSDTFSLGVIISLLAKLALLVSLGPR